MRLRRILLILVGLGALGAALVGCGNKAHQLMGSGASGTQSVTLDRSATATSVLTETNLCGHVELKNCDNVCVGLPRVKVTATWKDGPTLTQYTDDSGAYCFIGIIATGFDVDVCVDPATLPPGIAFVSTKYHQNAPNCQTVFLLYPNNVGDADFLYKKTDCGPPPPPPGLCSIPGSIDSGFNGTAVVGVSSGPAYIWFNSNISLKGQPAGTHVTLTNAQVIVNGTPHAVPDAIITFDNVPCATTTFDAANNVWRTTVPTAGSDEIFLAGLAWPTANLPGGAKVTFQGTFATDRRGICLSWKWGAAAYKTWTLDGGQPEYNAANIKPAHSGTCDYNNGDHAGTPENAMLKKAVTGGARGGGGSNFTGSWSSTGNLCPVCAQ